MSYPVAAAPTRLPRPQTVSAAVVLLWLVAVGVAVRGALETVLVLVYHVVPDLSFADIAPDQADQLLRVSAILLAVAFGLLAVGLVVIALFVRIGRNGARITAWVFAGLLGLCCGCQSLASGAGMVTDGTDAAAGPHWLVYTDLAAAVVVALMSVAVVVLLAMPVSNDFFRPPVPAGWVPPGYPGSPYPPQYPAQYPYAQPPPPPVEPPASSPPPQPPEPPASSPPQPPVDRGPGDPPAPSSP